MTKSRLSIGLFLHFAALCALFGYLCVTSDREPPVIYCAAEGETVYTGDDAALLEGMFATDKRDGDVTDTLVIDTVRVKSDGSAALVRYAARDRSGNLASYTRRIACAKKEETP